jgi:hypothetical protein
LTRCEREWQFTFGGANELINGLFALNRNVRKHFAQEIQLLVGQCSLKVRKNRVSSDYIIWLKKHNRVTSEHAFIFPDDKQDVIGKRKKKKKKKVRMKVKLGIENHLPDGPLDNITDESRNRPHFQKNGTRFSLSWKVHERGQSVNRASPALREKVTKRDNEVEKKKNANEGSVEIHIRFDEKEKRQSGWNL